MIVLIEKCRRFLDKGRFSDLLMTHLSIVFDCNDHELLIAKMHAYGFDIKSLKFINSYLAGRKQRVKVKSSFSEWSDMYITHITYICHMFFSETEIDLANYVRYWYEK